MQPDPNDGRGKLVYLTDPGRSGHREAIALVTETFKKIIAGEQIALMRRIRSDLEQMRKHLDDNR